MDPYPAIIVLQALFHLQLAINVINVMQDTLVEKELQTAQFVGQAHGLQLQQEIVRAALQGTEKLNKTHKKFMIYYTNLNFNLSFFK